MFLSVNATWNIGNNACRQDQTEPFVDGHSDRKSLQPNRRAKSTKRKLHFSCVLYHSLKVFAEVICRWHSSVRSWGLIKTPLDASQWSLSRVAGYETGEQIEKTVYREGFARRMPIRSNETAPSWKLRAEAIWNECSPWLSKRKSSQLRMLRLQVFTSRGYIWKLRLQLIVTVSLLL